MVQENVNNAGFARKAIQSSQGQISHIKAPEKVAFDNPVSTPDFSAAKGPAIPSDKNHLVQPESAEELAQRNRAVNLNLEFRDDDDFDTVSFDLASNDQMSVLVDRNPMAETHQIVETTLQELEDFSDIEMGQGVDPSDSSFA